MFKYTRVLAALGIGLAALLGNAKMSNAQTSPVTAIDIALEPDATMLEHAKADNARLLKVFPKGFALDATHHPHITMLQQFTRTADLDITDEQETAAKASIADFPARRGRWRWWKTACRLATDY